MSAHLLHLLTLYGLPVLTLVLAGAAVGLPLPASLLLLTAGTLARGGGGTGAAEITLLPLALCGLAAAVAGDSLGYWCGRRGGTALLHRWSRRRAGSTAQVARAEAALARWGCLAIVLTRCLVTVAGPPLNLIAGTGRYPFPAFVLYAALGEAIWIATYVGLGYAFGASWQAVASHLGAASGVLVLGGAIAGLVIVAWQALPGHRTSRASIG